MFGQPSSTRPIQRLNRAQQLTLNTWRLAARKLLRSVGPFAVLEHAALHAVLGTLRDVDEPLALFGRHAEAQPELALIACLVSTAPPDDLATTSWIPRLFCAGTSSSQTAPDPRSFLLCAIVVRPRST